MGYADRDKYGMYKRSINASGSGPGPALMGADTLIGDSVVNGAEQDLGDIKEIMLDMNTGQVAYVVLAFGGFLGMHEKLFAVPWQALHLDTAHHRFVLNVEKERLKTAPGFNKDSWPDMSDVVWTSQVHSFYGTDPQRGGAPTMGPGTTMQPMGGRSGAGMGMGAGGGLGAGSAGSAGSTGAAGSAGSTGAAGSSGSIDSSTYSPGSSTLGSGVGSAGGSGSSAGSSADPRAGKGGDNKDPGKLGGKNIG